MFSYPATKHAKYISRGGIIDDKNAHILEAQKAYVEFLSSLCFFKHQRRCSPQKEAEFS